MKEKNGLDKKTFINFDNDNFKESKDKKKICQKIENFIQNSPKCENFCYKEAELHSKIYWCNKINKSCTFSSCPKNDNENVNN